MKLYVQISPKLGLAHIGFIISALFAKQMYFLVEEVAGGALWIALPFSLLGVFPTPISHSAALGGENAW